MGNVFWPAGSSGTGFGNDVIVQALNNSSALVNDLELLTDFVSGVAGAEYGRWTIRLIQNGVASPLNDVAAFTWNAPNTARFYVGPASLANLFQSSSTNFQMLRGGAAGVSIDSTGVNVVSAHLIMAAGRMQELKGADIASASTITAVNGNYFHLTGTTAIDFLTFTSWQDGSRIELYMVGALTINHNTGGVPANTYAFDLAGGVNAVLTAGSRIAFRRDTALTKWIEVNRVVR
jgi:hypothetical protein